MCTQQKMPRNSDLNEQCVLGQVRPAENATNGDLNKKRVSGRVRPAENAT